MPAAVGIPTVDWDKNPEKPEFSNRQPARCRRSYYLRFVVDGKACFTLHVYKCYNSLAAGFQQIEPFLKGIYLYSTMLIS